MLPSDPTLTSCAPLGVAANAANLTGGPPLSGLGCTCGAGAQLEEERLRLLSHSRSIVERADALCVHEDDLNLRLVDAQEQAAALEASIMSFEGRRAQSERARCVGFQGAAEVARRDREVRCAEASCADLDKKLTEGETELSREEARLADEELLFLEARARVEAELGKLWAERCAQRDRAAADEASIEFVISDLRDTEAEEATMFSDQTLLAEVEASVAPVDAILRASERNARVREAELRAREVDCDEREALALPRHARVKEALDLAAGRLREARAQEEEGERQRSRLLGMQRDLGNAGARLAGREEALLQGHLPQQPRGGVAPPLATAASAAGLQHHGQPQRSWQLRNEANDHVVSAVPGASMTAARDNLRAADDIWARRVRGQQEALLQLEARAAEMQAPCSAMAPV